MPIQESGENYLETILVLHTRSGKAVRSVDVAAELGVSKPSVSRAMGILRENGFINMEKGGAITLTPKGLEHAGHVLERHTVITSFLENVLGVDPETADKDACRIEHIISSETFERIKNFNR